jgi:hypothetical protein
MSLRPKRAAKPTQKIQEQSMVEEAPERPAVALRRANPVHQKPVQAEKAAVKRYPAVSTDQKVRVCEAQLKIHDFKERWYAKSTRLEVLKLR